MNVNQSAEIAADCFQQQGILTVCSGRLPGAPFYTRVPLAFYRRKVLARLRLPAATARGRD